MRPLREAVSGVDQLLKNFAATNIPIPAATFTAFATANLALPSSNWTALGGVTDLLRGQFQFTDSEATNSGQRFYLIRSP